MPRNTLREGDDAGTADEVLDGGLFDPACGFGGFGFEFGHGFDRVNGRRDFQIVSAEFERGADGAGQGAISFFIETGRDGIDGIREEASNWTLTSSIPKRVLTVWSCVNMAVVEAGYVLRPQIAKRSFLFGASNLWRAWEANCVLRIQATRLNAEGAESAEGRG